MAMKELLKVTFTQQDNDTSFATCFWHNVHRLGGKTYFDRHLPNNEEVWIEVDSLEVLFEYCEHCGKG